MNVGVARVVVFLALFSALTLLWSSRAAAALQGWVIARLTVAPAAWLIDRFDPGQSVAAVGPRLATPGHSVQVLPGCEGADIAFLLTSAMLCAPLAWRARWLGLLVGGALVFVLNQARVIGLFYAAGHDRALFSLLHGTLLPLGLVLAVGAFFLAWLAHGPGARSPAA